MKLQALAKLDLLTAAREASLLETLDRHSKTLLHYEAQRTVLTAYQERLSASWRGGAVVTAGDATRAAKFVAQAEEARRHLAQSIKTEQDKRNECALSLATLRTRRETLQERLKTARQVAANVAQDREDRNRPIFSAPITPDDSLF